ncbi:glycoside hydrolase [Lipomyces doorenjongii]
MSSCNGVLMWQIFEFNNGYDYKNTISNAGLFLMAARLARFTANTTYIDWAELMWDWVEGVGLMDTDYYYFYDGASVSTNCTQVTRYRWFYNAACFLAGSAYLYSLTVSDVWRDRTQNILDGLLVQSILVAFMGLTAILAPWTYDRIYESLVNTVVNGISYSCTGGHDGVTCGTTWLAQEWDNTAGLGQQMTALETVQNLLISQVPAPYTAEMFISAAERSSGGCTGSCIFYLMLVIPMVASWLICV